MLIALRTSSSIPIHGDDASAVYNYLKDMNTIKSNSDAGNNSTDDDPLHLRTLLLDNGYGTREDMGCVTTMEARVSLRPGHPSGGPWATVRASGCATDKRSRERLAKLAMVASLYAQGFAAGEWNTNLRDDSPGWVPQQFVMHVVDNVIGELQACARSGPRNASRVPPEMGGRETALDDSAHSSN